MPDKNDVSSLNIEPSKKLPNSSVSHKKPGRRPKPPEEKCSETVCLKFTPLEMRALKKHVGMVPLATYIKQNLLKKL